MKFDYNLNKLKIINFVDLSYDEALQILQMRNDKRISQWMFVDRIIDIDEHLGFINHLKQTKNQIYYAIKNTANDCFVGVVALNSIDFVNKNAFIGIYANPAMLHLKRKQGIGHQLMEILKHIGFHQLSLHILFARCLSENLQALRFYKKENFFECGILPESVQRGDKFSDTIILALKRE